jgi:hypothetical protein
MLLSCEYHLKQEKVNTMLRKQKRQIPGFEMTFLSRDKNEKPKNIRI